MATGKTRSKPSPNSARNSRATDGRQGYPTRLLGAGLVIGVYAMIPAFFLAGLHVRKGVEVVDHAIPGLVVLALVFVAIVRKAKPETLMLATGVGVLLAGLWMAATHLSLVSQALKNQASATGAAYHCSTAVAVLALGGSWVWQYREAGSPPPTPARRPATKHRR